MSGEIAELQRQIQEAREKIEVNEKAKGLINSVVGSICGSVSYFRTASKHIQAGAVINNSPADNGKLAQYSDDIFSCANSLFGEISIIDGEIQRLNDLIESCQARIAELERQMAEIEEMNRRLKRTY